MDSGSGVDHDRLAPRGLLRPGKTDATALLALWLARKLFLPALFLGIILAVLVTRDVENLGVEIQRRLDRLYPPDELLETLASPFALIIIALGLRLAVAIVAFSLAFPLTTWNRSTDYSRGGRVGGPVRLLVDRLHVTSSVRSLRWSWAVRQSAADRMGTPGRVLEGLSRPLSWIAAALFVGVVWVIAAAG